MSASFSASRLLAMTNSSRNSSHSRCKAASAPWPFAEGTRPNVFFRAVANCSRKRSHSRRKLSSPAAAAFSARRASRSALRASRSDLLDSTSRCCNSSLRFCSAMTSARHAAASTFSFAHWAVSSANLCESSSWSFALTAVAFASAWATCAWSLSRSVRSDSNSLRRVSDAFCDSSNLRWVVSPKALALLKSLEVVSSVLATSAFSFRSRSSFALLSAAPLNWLSAFSMAALACASAAFACALSAFACFSCISNSSFLARMALSASRSCSA
mmetsp:Transcript_89783/g.253193  ORF Transcript_89783/g.253193 Transcript_89783/m.253193 type:complete len:271 (+) Transcript_89783:337-1149(+)